jgi:8-oxo-dGTP pyrophosphatase MutT (NUDIX family)
MYAAVYLILLKQDKVLLLQRRHTGFEDGNYSLPTGHLEKGENVRFYSW